MPPAPLRWVRITRPICEGWGRASGAERARGATAASAPSLAARCQGPRARRHAARTLTGFPLQLLTLPQGPGGAPAGAPGRGLAPTSAPWPPGRTLTFWLPCYGHTESRKRTGAGSRAVLCRALHCLLACCCTILSSASFYAADPPRHWGEAFLRHLSWSWGPPSSAGSGPRRRRAMRPPATGASRLGRAATNQPPPAPQLLTYTLGKRQGPTHRQRRGRSRPGRSQRRGQCRSSQAGCAIMMSPPSLPPNFTCLHYKAS